MTKLDDAHDRTIPRCGEMATFELIFVTSGLGDASDPRTEYLLNSFDGVVSSHGGLTLAALSCPGRSALDAAVRAVTELETHGVQVLRLHEDLVTRAEIARRAGVTPQNVGQWIRGERHGGFSAPHNVAAGGVYLWHDVNAWLETIGRGDSMRHPDAHDCAWINGHLATPRPLSGHGDVGNCLDLQRRTEILRATLDLLHRRAAEEQMARSVDEFYGGSERSLPIGARPARTRRPDSAS
jgi:hypothetical protein